MEDSNIPVHIGIIMDGNRRWARKRLLPEQLGHKEGVETLERIAKYCQAKGIRYLTVFAFSTENWNRSKEEVDYLMSLLKKNIVDFDKRFQNRDIRIQLVGNRNKIPQDLLDGIDEIEARTKDKKGLTMNIAINYGGRDEIVSATQKIAKAVMEGKIKTIESIDESLLSQYMFTKDIPDPDLIIRTSGELRTSGFLTWQSVYSEWYFTKTLWPDFNEQEMEKALEEYKKRKRKFGK